MGVKDTQTGETKKDFETIKNALDEVLNDLIKEIL